MKTEARPRERAADPRPRRDGFSRMLLFVGLGVAAFLVFFPARQVVSQQVQIHQLEERLGALQEENEELAHEVERLSDAEDLRLTARERFGLVEPGERLYVFTPTPTPEPAPEPAGEAGSPPFWSRAWSWIVSVVRGEG